jgi:hypothetical protein
LRTRVEQAQRTLQVQGRFDAGDATNRSAGASIFAANPCASALAAAEPGLGPVQAVGTARLHGRPATVVVTTTASGTAVAIAITDAGCTVGRPVELTSR